jgi:hypothetical protein
MAKLNKLESLLESFYQKQDAELQARHEKEKQALRVKQFEMTENVHMLCKGSPKITATYIKILQAQ